MHIEGIQLTSKNMSMTWWLEQQAHEQVCEVTTAAMNLTALYRNHRSPLHFL